MFHLILISSTAAVTAVVFKKSIIGACRCCFGCLINFWNTVIRRKRRSCQSTPSVPYDKQRSTSISSDETEAILIGDINPDPPLSPTDSSPPTTPTSPNAQVSPEILSTVEEERTSQISTDNTSSLHAVELVAGSLVDIASQFSLDRISEKSGESAGSKSKKHSPSKSPEQKSEKSDCVHVDIGEEQVSFTVVKERRSPKRKSPEKLPLPTSYSPEKGSLKPSPPKRPPPRPQSPDIQVCKPKFTDKPSRPVNSNFSYAQIASNSAQANEGIDVDQEAALFAIKEPEPPKRPTLRQIQQDSSESNSDAPVIFQTISEVHRADSTESDYSEEAKLPPSEPKPEDTGVDQSSTAESSSDAPPVIFQTISEVHRADSTESDYSEEAKLPPSEPKPEDTGVEQSSKAESRKDETEKDTKQSSENEGETKQEEDKERHIPAERPSSVAEPNVDDEPSESIEESQQTEINVSSVVLARPPTAVEEIRSDNITSEQPPVSVDNKPDSPLQQQIRIEIDSCSSNSISASNSGKDPALLGFQSREDTLDDLSDISNREVRNYSGETDSEANSRSEQISLSSFNITSASGQQPTGSPSPVEDYDSHPNRIKIQIDTCSSNSISTPASGNIPDLFRPKLRDNTLEDISEISNREVRIDPSEIEANYGSEQLSLGTDNSTSGGQPVSSEPSVSEDNKQSSNIDVEPCSAISTTESNSQQDPSSIEYRRFTCETVSEVSNEEEKVQPGQTETSTSSEQVNTGADVGDQAQSVETSSASISTEKSTETEPSVTDKPSEGTTEGSRESSFRKKNKKKKKGKKKNQGSSNTTSPSTQPSAILEENTPELAQPSLEEGAADSNISISSVVVVEEGYIQEGEEVENTEINIPAHREEGEEIPIKVEKNFGYLRNQKMEQVRVLTLNDKEFHESVLFRLEQDWIIEFRLGPTLFGRKIDVFCNFPTEEGKTLKEFDRNEYRKLEWLQDGGTDNSDDTALYAQVKCSISGNFQYYLKDNNSKDEPLRGSGYFLVDPILTYGDNENLPLDCVQCQTVITKHLGSFSSWESKLKVSKESGYNMVHFTPIQELGESNSAYCLNDHLKMNPSFRKENGDMPTFDELRALIQKMKKEWKVISICDIVLNHTANKTPWVLEHPEATYNCLNCKYLRPSYLLDAACSVFQREVKEGLYETRGIPPVIDTVDHLNAMRYHLMEFLLRDLRLHELYICDVNAYVSKFMEMARQRQPDEEAKENVELNIIQDPDYRRMASSVDMELAMKIYNIYRPGCFDEDARLRSSCEQFKNKLDALNRTITDRIQDHLNVAVNNICEGVNYWWVSSGGPKLEEITIQHPLIPRYFTDYGEPKSLKEHEDVMYSENSRFLMAHNGWIMGGYDCLVNFAGPKSDVYIRRRLDAWGDSVKLRYGDEPSDSPFLWDMMRKYVELTASIFDGVRLDNCHSTPLKVAEYLVDCARRVRPNIYVVAELFTDTVERDHLFVNRIGLSSLIREAMSSPESFKLGEAIHRFGGMPVGSFYQPNVQPLSPSIAHALLFDLTHDNDCPIKVRSVFNYLPNAALVSMACCGTGSNRGYDELVPHKISVVDETRDYAEWSLENADNSISLDCGIIRAKKALNELHFKLGIEGFNQVYVDQMNSDVVAVTRHCPKTHQRYILVAYTAFETPKHDCQTGIRPLIVEGVLDEIILEANLSHSDLGNGGFRYAGAKYFQMSDRYINGYTEYDFNMRQNIQLDESEVFEKIPSGNPNEIALQFKNFRPGSIVIIKVSLPKVASEAVSEVRKLTQQFSYVQETDLKRIIKKLELRDLNKVLYKCDQEEQEEGFSVYGIPGYGGQLVYAGLQGFISLLAKIRSTNDLGHPMCENIRQGDWMIDYIYQRLTFDEGTQELGAWIEENTKCLKAVPKYMKPAYFDLIFTGIYVSLLEHAYNSLSSFVKDGSMFVKALAMGSIQFAGYVRSADLPRLSPNLTPPKPPSRIDKDWKETEICVSLSAGLPHFSVGYMRNWGRDTFISLRGLLLLTGRHQEARYIILAYAACLRHGLIPNLLDGGRKPRYNCRDAVWWWLYCIKCYVEEVPGGASILGDEVSRIFPTDDSPPQQPGAMDQSLQDVMQEALTRHFQGVTFRERNAGREIDEQMTDKGFNNQIGVHPDTGFVFGGNVHNCGTWMDKMGSSSKAGNKGKPATPRDGSACEIVGLSKCVISWLVKMNAKGLYKHSGVERTHSSGQKTKWSFKSWADKIQQNFEKYFWVNEKPCEGENDVKLINKRGIYKDCHGSTQKYSDYQLRCNFPIVMVVAPELFDPQHAWTALGQVEKILLGPLGMKTLDPEDWAYCGDYDNSNDSADSKVAQGFNYHQGPEWLWPIGFFLRAKLYFAAKNGKLKETIAETKCRLSRHFTELQTSDWRGLPELTNKNGSKCEYSSATQAWSMSCVLEVLHDLPKIESSIQ
ncbi:glycogen debranching enzyme [Harmonia axyridis]|uniref:glycogen debranching enzyme n=1 Tax=Harmonia axyridis TaxID=115357 RepID=UPI001E27811C|nr:glycogen debranching enzyme [Harmonia axyridis]